MHKTVVFKDSITHLGFVRKRAANKTFNISETVPNFSDIPNVIEVDFSGNALTGLF